MDDKGPVIKTNGKTIREFMQRGKRGNKKETAATLEESNETVPKQVSQISTKTKRNRHSIVKPILISSISALFIGTLLSIIMFRLFVHIDQDIPSPSASIPSTDRTDTEAVDTSSVNRVTHSLKPFQFFVLQAGVFSEQANAEQWASDFQQMGISSVTWERDNQVYLFIGIASTKEEADRIKNQMNIDEEKDIFVKEWSTKAQEIELAEDEIKWMTTFHEIIDSLVTKGGTLSLSKGIFEQLPEIKNTETIGPLIDDLNNLEELNGSEAQIFLLQLIKKYESIR